MRLSTLTLTLRCQHEHASTDPARFLGLAHNDYYNPSHTEAA